MSSARFVSVQGDPLSPKEAAESLSDPSCPTRLEDLWAPERPPRTIMLERQCALFMIGTTSELDVALRSARRNGGIEQILTCDGGPFAIWYVRVATDPETTKTMISIAGLNDYWNRSDPLDTYEGWSPLVDRGEGRVPIQKLLDEWLPGSEGVDSWLRTY